MRCGRGHQDKRSPALYRGANSMPTTEIPMNGAPEIERHAYGVSLFYWTATRSLKYIKGGAWGASAPRLRAQARDTRDRFAPNSQ